jgi:hypothetical protein
MISVPKSEQMRRLYTANEVAGFYRPELLQAKKAGSKKAISKVESRIADAENHLSGKRKGFIPLILFDGIRTEKMYERDGDLYSAEEIKSYLPTQQEIAMHCIMAKNLRIKTDPPEIVTYGPRHVAEYPRLVRIDEPSYACDCPYWGTEY